MDVSEVIGMCNAMEIDIRALVDMIDVCVIIGKNSMPYSVSERAKIIELQIDSIIQDAKAITNQAACLCSNLSTELIETLKPSDRRFIAGKLFIDMVNKIYKLCDRITGEGFTDEQSKIFSRYVVEQTGDALFEALSTLSGMYEQKDISRLSLSGTSAQDYIRGIVRIYKADVTHNHHANPYAGSDATDSVSSGNSTAIAKPAPPPDDNRGGTPSPNHAPRFPGKNALINNAAKNTQFIAGMSQILQDSGLTSIPEWKFSAKNTASLYPNPHKMMNHCKDSANSMFMYTVTENAAMEKIRDTENIVDNYTVTENEANEDMSNTMNLAELALQYLKKWLNACSYAKYQGIPENQQIVLRYPGGKPIPKQPFRAMQCVDDNSLQGITMLLRVEVNEKLRTIEFKCIVPSSVTPARMGCAICGKKLLCPER